MVRKPKKPKYFKCAYDSLLKKIRIQICKEVFKAVFNAVIKEWLRIGLYSQILALATTPNSTAWRVMSFCHRALESMPPGYWWFIIFDQNYLQKRTNNPNDP